MNVFTEKIGPLPVYAYGAIIGVIVVGYIWMNGSKTSSTTPVVANGTGTTLDTGYVASGVQNSTGSTYTPPVASSVETNQSWLTSAVNALTDRSGLSPVDVQTALQNYLYGQPLTEAQKAIVDKAIGTKGVAPEGTQTPIVVAPVVDPNANAIANYYQMFLGRAVSPTELTYWENLVKYNGRDLEYVRSQIAGSPEASKRK